MKELIRITPHQIDKHTTQTCDARELHCFLKNGARFADWIKDRIEQYGYEEGKDFEVFRKSEKNPSGGRPAIEYILDIEMGKELAMVEKSDMGRIARRYFIACERMATEQIPLLAAELLRTKPLWQKIKRYKEMGLLHVEIARLLPCHVSLVRREVRKMEACGMLPPPVNLKQMQAQAQRLLPGMEEHLSAGMGHNGKKWQGLEARA